MSALNAYCVSGCLLLKGKLPLSTYHDQNLVNLFEINVSYPKFYHHAIFSAFTLPGVKYHTETLISRDIHSVASQTRPSHYAQRSYPQHVSFLISTNPTTDSSMAILSLTVQFPKNCSTCVPSAATSVYSLTCSTRQQLVISKFLVSHFVSFKRDK